MCIEIQFCFFRLTTTLTSLIGIVAGKFSDKLNQMLSKKDEDCKENINNLITNVFFEVINIYIITIFPPIISEPNLVFSVLMSVLL